MEMLLHSGVEHPNTLWIAVTAILTFALGVGVGVYSRTVRGLLGANSVDE